MPDSSTGFLSARAWDIGLKVGLVLTPLIGGALIAHEVAIREIQTSRFRDHDGEVMKAEIKDWVEERLRDFPPLWLREQIGKIDNATATNAKGIIEVNSRLQRIEAKLDG